MRPWPLLLTGDVGRVPDRLGLGVGFGFRGDEAKRLPRASLGPGEGARFGLEPCPTCWYANGSEGAGDACGLYGRLGDGLESAKGS